MSRTFLGALAAGLVASTGALAQQTLVINSFGGDYERHHRELIIEPFERLHDVRIEVVTAYSADAAAQIRAQRESPQFDVIHLSGGLEAPLAAEGLLAPIRPDQLTNYADMYPFAVEGIEEGRGPMYHVAVIGILYDTQALADPPSSWKDVFDDKYRDHLVLTDIGNQWGLLSFLAINHAYGGSLDDITPGLEAIRPHLDHATIVTRSPDIQQAFAQGHAWVAPYAQDYGYTLTSAGLPVAFIQPEEGAPVAPVTVNLVAGRPNTELAIRFIDFTIRAEAQRGWAERMRYSPTSRAAELDSEVAADVTYGEDAIAGLLAFDPMVIGEKRAEWTDAWNRMIAR